MMARQGKQPADDSLNTAGLDAPANPGQTKQRACFSNVAKQTQKGSSARDILSGGRLVDGMIDDPLRRVHSPFGERHGTGSWERECAEVKRRRSVSSRRCGRFPIDPSPSAGAAGRMD
jgi:hypothetical protein